MRLALLLLLAALVAGCASPRYAVRASYTAPPTRPAEGVLAVHFEATP